MVSGLLYTPIREVVISEVIAYNSAPKEVGKDLQVRASVKSGSMLTFNWTTDAAGLTVVER